MRKKGIRNLQNRLDRDYRTTCDELLAEGLIFTDDVEFDLTSPLDERSKRCIVPEGGKWTTFAEIADEMDRRGYHFSLRLYELFGFWGPGECKVDFQSVECFDFKAFTEELAELLENEGVIMRTWKYKASVIYPRPILVWDGQYEGCYGKVYKLDNRKSSFKKLEAVARKIEDLAISHLTWCEIDDETESV